MSLSLKNGRLSATTIIDGFLCELELDDDSTTLDISKTVGGIDYFSSIGHAEMEGCLHDSDFERTLRISSTTVNRISDWEDSLVISS
jgi:hypothetical protein